MHRIIICIFKGLLVYPKIFASRYLILLKIIRGCIFVSGLLSDKFKGILYIQGGMFMLGLPSDEFQGVVFIFIQEMILGN